MRWKFVEQLDIASERGARENTFEQIVAQQGVLFDLAGQRGFKCIEIVDSLPGVRALVKQVLINVGNSRGVRIDSTGPGKNSLEERAFTIGGSEGVTRGCTTP